MQLGVAIKIIKQNKMKCSSLTWKFLLMILTQARHDTESESCVGYQQQQPVM